MNTELSPGAGERRQGPLSKFRRGVHQLLFPDIETRRERDRRQMAKAIKRGRGFILIRSAEAAMATPEQVANVSPARSNLSEEEVAKREKDEREWRQAEEALQTGRGVIYVSSSEGDHISPEHLHQLQPEESAIDEEEK